VVISPSVSDVTIKGVGTVKDVNGKVYQVTMLVTPQAINVTDVRKILFFLLVGTDLLNLFESMAGADITPFSRDY